MSSLPEDFSTRSFHLENDEIHGPHQLAHTSTITVLPLKSGNVNSSLLMLVNSNSGALVPGSYFADYVYFLETKLQSLNQTLEVLSPTNHQRM